MERYRFSVNKSKWYDYSQQSPNCLSLCSQQQNICTRSLFYSLWGFQGMFVVCDDTQSFKMNITHNHLDFIILSQNSERHTFHFASVPGWITFIKPPLRFAIDFKTCRELKYISFLMPHFSLFSKSSCKWQLSLFCFSAGWSHKALPSPSAQGNDIYHQQLPVCTTSEWVSESSPLYSLNNIR